MGADAGIRARPAQSIPVIRPALQEDAFLADVERAASERPDALHLWWLGQSGYLIAHAGVRLLLDPYLSDSLTRKYAGTDRPHVRMTERVVAPERLRGIAFVTSSHNHTDHLDAETLLPLFSANPEARLVLPEANLDFAGERLGEAHRARFVGMHDGRAVEIAGIRIEGVPAAHESLSPEFLGYVLTIGPWTLYHSGDCIPYDGLVERLAPYQVDLALLPINGRAPERRVAGNFAGEEAAQIARAIGAARVLPCHYEMFAFNTASPAPFEAACRRLAQPCTVLKAGERWSSLPAP